MREIFDSKLNRLFKESNPEAIREMRCTSKDRYGSLEIAQQACKDMARKGYPGLTPYQCGDCKVFHIGHKPGKR